MSLNINFFVGELLFHYLCRLEVVTAWQWLPEQKTRREMQYRITAPRTLDTAVNLPPSKSVSNRALVIHALSHGDIMPQNLSECDDTEVMVRALSGNDPTVDIKAAGTSMRFLTAYYATTPGEHTLTGTARMKQRPIALLVDALRYLGADIEYLEQEGFPPLHIKGKPLDGGYLEIPGNVSSQYISALLMIGPTLKNGLQLRMTGEIVSKPYIDLTLWTMREFGAEADWTDADMVSVAAQPYVQRRYTIESDWSAASYWYEMMALCPDREARLSFKGLHDASKQGDSVVKYIFSLLGVKTRFDRRDDAAATSVKLKKQPTFLPRLDYDFIGSPDLAQTVVVACCLMNVPFRFTGLASLRIKETDRIEALEREMKKLGYVLHDENGDTLYWDGEQCDATLQPIDTYDDHRMAMAFAPAAFHFPEVIINNPQVVTKSYPQYWDHLRQAGFKVEPVGKEEA